MSRPQLRERRSLSPRQAFLRWGDWRRSCAEEWIFAELTDSVPDRVSVDFLECGRVGRWISGAVDKIRHDRWKEFRLKRTLHGPGTGRRCNHSMRRMRRAKAAEERLFAKHVEVVLYKRVLGLVVKVRDGGEGVAT